MAQSNCFAPFNYPILTINARQKSLAFLNLATFNFMCPYEGFSKEISQMPTTFRKTFRTAGCNGHVLRRKSGRNNHNYMIRYRRDGYNIVVCSNNLEEAKRKFIEKLHTADELKKQQEFAKITGVLITPTPLLKQQE